MALFSRSIEMIDFVRGAKHWRYARGNRSVTVAGVPFLPSLIKRSGISESPDLTRNTLDFTVSQDLEFLDQFKGSAPMQQIDVTLLSLRVSDNALSTRWKGVVGGVTFETHDAKIHCLPPMSSLQGLGLRRCWQKSCPHVLYGAGDGQCNASRELVKAQATITEVTGNVVKAAAFAAQADGWWSGGYFTWQTGETSEVRFITTHAGDTVTLLTPALIAVGTVVTALPGCDHTIETCSTKFTSTDPNDQDGNSANYGGQLWIPEKNPFGADNIY